VRNAVAQVELVSLRCCFPVRQVPRDSAVSPSSPDSRPYAKPYAATYLTGERSEARDAKHGLGVSLLGC
jgi:hypothetical protein